MLTLQIILSSASMVTHNCLLNNVCKKELSTQDHIYRFNIISYTVCILLFGILTFQNGLSWFTVGMGVLFGVITALSNLYKMLALANGPMHITLLITTASMIIPTFSGVFFGESFSFPKLIVVAILLFFIYLSLGKKENGGFNKAWFLYVALAFVLQGSIGVLQKIHQSSAHKSETGGFLLIAFICSLIYSRIRAKKTFGELKFTKRILVFSLICGICVFGMNFINLKLSGLLPSQLFFPLVNGSAIILSSLASLLFFREKLTKRQLVGLFGGIASLILICIVP